AATLPFDARRADAFDADAAVSGRELLQSTFAIHSPLRVCPAIVRPVAAYATAGKACIFHGYGGDTNCGIATGNERGPQVRAGARDAQDLARDNNELHCNTNCCDAPNWVLSD